MAGLDSAWVLLKNRGQELMLPPPREPSEFPGTSLPTGLPTAGLSPQEMTDRRVDARNERNNLESLHDLWLRYLAMPNGLPMRSYESEQEKLLNAGKLANAPYNPYYGSGEYQSELQEAMRRVKEKEDAYEHAQRRLDQQTMTRMGQQGEADEMDAMGVPEMGRTLSERPRMPPVGPDDLHPDDLADMTDEEIEAYTDEVEARGPFNPFPRPTMKSLDAAWSLLKMLP